MSKVVYLFGAGINRGIKAHNGAVPPLASDLFVQAMKLGISSGFHDSEKGDIIFQYIKRFWKLDRAQLATSQFDLEACYTLLQLQLQEAKNQNNQEDIFTLQSAIQALTRFFAKTLKEFELLACTSDAFRLLGQIIQSENADVLTFNYDTLIESAIETSSRCSTNFHQEIAGKQTDISKISQEEIRYSHFNWNRPLGYGVKFDEVMLQRAGRPVYLPGQLFYDAHPEGLYKNSILKLHGSLNWFVFSGIPVESYEKKSFITRRGQTVLSTSFTWLEERPQIHGEVLEPLIITPSLYKNYSENDIISKTWRQAKNLLTSCNRLVVGGYSFPPTDFAVRKLFLEAFESHSPDDIVVINPDTSVVKTIKDLSHFDKPILVCKDLDEYVKLFKGFV